jgi:hypothetical protein
MLLHFAPKMRHWVLPPLELLGPEYVGINILKPVSAPGLRYIVNRMCQLVGLPLPNFDTYPKTLESTMIMHAWEMLELPMTGVQSLEIHLIMRLMFGEPVRCIELRAMWAAFPMTSNVCLEAAHNFIRSHLESGYRSGGANKFGEFHAIQDWIKEDNERKAFFRELNNQYQLGDGGEISMVKVDKTNEATATELEKETALLKESVDKNHEILVRGRTLRLSNKERNEWVEKDRTELKYRLRRLKSDDTLRSLDVENSDAESENEDTLDGLSDQLGGTERLEEKAKKSFERTKKHGNSFSQGIDVEVLAKALEGLTELEERVTRGKERRKERRGPDTTQVEQGPKGDKGRGKNERQPVSRREDGDDAAREEFPLRDEGLRGTRRDERRKERRKARTETENGADTIAGKIKKALDTDTDAQLLSQAGDGSVLAKALEKFAPSGEAGGGAQNED